MTRLLNVHLLPSLCDPVDLQGGIAVMIDVLRASTTIVHALANGARAVFPFTDVEAVRQDANQHPGGSVVTGGERNGERIPGFDLDNSPLNYTRERIDGKTVLFTTTNGTQALKRCSQADRVLIGAFVNLDAIVSTLRHSGAPIHLVCAGTDGEVTTEDALCAGAIARGLEAVSPTAPESTYESNDAARIASDLFALHGQEPSTLLAALRASCGGQNLVGLGFDDDIERAASVDLFDTVPEYNPLRRLITPAAAG